MDKFHDNILFITKQHKITLFMDFFKWVVIVLIPLFLVIYYWLEISNFIKILISLILVLFIFIYYFFFWWKSYFVISNKKISLKVRNWIFSKYHMSIYYENIKDIAYSKNHLFHYILNYWTFFARSSPWSNWDFIIKNIPKVENIYKIVNYLHALPKEKRELLEYLDINSKEKNIDTKIWNNESMEDIIKKEKTNLLLIKWLKEVILLDDNDKKYIFENEEDVNHWIHETIRKKIVFCFTHDSNFRDADSQIVLKLWKKVIFPAISFHEINRASVVSSSPWVEIHNYLLPKFENLDKDDATVLVWFDL